MEVLHSPPRMQLSHSDFEGFLPIDSVGGELYMLESIFIPLNLNLPCYCVCTIVWMAMIVLGAGVVRHLSTSSFGSGGGSGEYSQGTSKSPNQFLAMIIVRVTAWILPLNSHPVILMSLFHF